MTRKKRLEWIEALRSGKYTQGSNALARKRDGVMEYCCLGVLADLDGQLEDFRHGKKRARRTQSTIAYRGHEQLGSVLPPGASDMLIAMNDSGYSFDQIADYIMKWEDEV
jgi:hypothetical protein